MRICRIMFIVLFMYKSENGNLYCYISMKWVLLYLVKTGHALFFLFMLFGPWLISDFNVLCVLLFFTVLLYYSWYMLNICFITLIEEYLGEPSREYEDTHKKSFISVWIQEATGWSDQFILNVCSAIPAVNAMVCLWKIQNLYHINVYSPG